MLPFKKYKFVLFFWVLLIHFGVACKASKSDVKTVFKVTLVDSVQAAKLITTDNSDGFFDQISALEMAIQMKNPAGYPDRASALKAFIPFLKTQVSNPTTADKAYVDSMFYYLRKNLEVLNPALLIDEVNIVKIKLGHYGAGTFYTRENTIFIPEDAFKKDWKSNITTMYHELWHILSRKYPGLRKSAYGLIGFESHGIKLKFDEALSSKVLTNPDGANYDYAIKLQDDLVIPVLTSKLPKYDASAPAFFDYINFDFYDIEANGKVDTIPAALKSMEGFFEKIKDNTQYIIHPDEIMADNFALAAEAFESKKYDQFSPGGKELIDEFTKVLMAFKQ